MGLLTRILVFIDESGNPWRGEDTFTAAACWCVPATKEGIVSVLRYTLDETRRKVEKLTGKLPREIHYSDGLRRYAEPLVSTIIEKSPEDSSIVRKDSDHPWSKHPLGCSTAIFTPVAESATMTDEEFPNILRARALLSLLRPLVVYGGSQSFEVSVVLDDDCWKKSLDLCSSIKDIASKKGVAISFSCEKSVRIPGLQIADLMAGITRDYYRNGIAEDAFRIIEKLNIRHLGAKVVPYVEPLDKTKTL